MASRPRSVVSFQPNGLLRSKMLQLSKVACRIEAGNAVSFLVRPHTNHACASWPDKRSAIPLGHRALRVSDLG